MERVKFTHITRTIDPRSGVHYLDAISEDGIHYSAEMTPGIEKWLVFTKQWSANRQQPYD